MEQSHSDMRASINEQEQQEEDDGEHTAVKASRSRERVGKIGFVFKNLRDSWACLEYSSVASIALIVWVFKKIFENI